MGTQAPPQFPYPGDGANATAWFAYDVSFAAVYALLAAAAGALLWRVSRQIRRERRDGRTADALRVKTMRRVFYLLVLLQTARMPTAEVRACACWCGSDPRTPGGRGWSVAAVRSVFFVLASRWRRAPPTNTHTIALEALVLLADAFYFFAFTVLVAYWSVACTALLLLMVVVVSRRRQTDGDGGTRGVVDFTSRGQSDRRTLILRLCYAVNALFTVTLIVFTAMAVTNVRLPAFSARGAGYPSCPRGKEPGGRAGYRWAGLPNRRCVLFGHGCTGLPDLCRADGAQAAAAADREPRAHDCAGPPLVACT
jgi:hypothetical protein